MRSAIKASVAVLCAVVFLGVGPATNAHADICGDVNPMSDTNGSFVDSCGVNLNAVYDGDLFARLGGNQPVDGDFYGFNIPAPMRLTVSVQNRSSPPACVNAWLYNGAARFLASGANCGNGGQPPTQYSYDITQPGTYYLEIGQPSRNLAANRYQFQLTGTGVPGVPTNLYATPVNDTTIRVEWVGNAPDATRFNVEGNGTARSATASPYEWTGLTAGTKVCFRVQAVNAVGTSELYPRYTPSDICATTPNLQTGITGSSGGIRPTAATETPPPPPPPANVPPPPPPGTTIAPVAPPTAKPKPPVSRRCVTAKADVRQLRRVVSNDRDKLDAASTRRRRNKIRDKLAEHKDRLAGARKRVRRNC